MKRILLAVFLLPALTVLHAQDLKVDKSAPALSKYKPFKLDLSTAWAIPGGSGAKAGVAFAIEPKYAIIDKFALGLRLEWAVTARGWVAADGSSTSANVAASGSYLATYDYYLPGLVLRPFIGGGTGLYNMASASVSETSQNGTVVAAASSKFGQMLRAGFEVGHFRMAFEYNLIGKTSESFTDGSTGTTSSIYAKNSYAAIKLGFFIGGGKR
jgi:outer membrane protein X